MSGYKFEEEEYPLRTFTERDWGDTSRLLYHDGYSTAPLPSQRGRVAPARHWVDSLPRDTRHSSRDERSTAFLDHVVLDPGWEANHPPKDIIGFTLNETIEHMKQNPPPDRYYAVFIILLLHGVAITLPWNIFIASKTYFEDYKLNSTEGTRPEYRGYYITYSTLAFQAPQALLNLVNLLLQRNKGPSPVWTVTSLLFMVALLIANVVLAMLDNLTWPKVFFGITMGTILLLGVFSGIFMNNVFGLSAIFPKNYTSAVVLGTNIGGVISSLAILSVVALSPGVRISAIYFFLTAIILLLVTFDTFFILPYLRYNRHYRAIVAMKLSANAGAVIKEKQKRPMLHIFKQIFPVVVSVWFVHFSSAVIYPAMLENTQKMDKKFPIPDVYWIPLFCFLSFTVFATTGNVFTLWIKKPSGRYLWIPVLLRTVIILPFFLLCNYRSGTRSLAVLIDSDYAFLAGGAVLGLTHGYMGGLSMMHGPAKVEAEHASTAGMILSAVMCLGVLCGTNFSIVVQLFVDNVGNG